MPALHSIGRALRGGQNAPRSQSTQLVCPADGAYVLIGQASHSALPLNAANLPGAQGKGTADPALQLCPAKQALHAAAEVSPNLSEYVPLSQLSAAALPSGQKVPGLQMIGMVVAAGQRNPAERPAKILSRQYRVEKH